ncbi:DUF305 domain-containing protein [uncultured Salinibacterium sp.]|uniref:DUF305 domain-containing protein n=1 Tax=uncultured Salinibacterium sp. TaxID=459274 RepID=UPI0030DD7E51|tara:strand:- start:5370 stop:5987 length:618 start_codon:yes stop_codon:yes gene_type:complete
MPQVVAAVLAAVLLLIAGIFLGRLVFPVAPSTPSTTSAEAGFARDMQVHHQQAIEMSMIIREKSNNEEIRTLAYDIATAQGQQAGQMYGWLTMWKLPQASAEPSMTWMMQPTLDGSPSDMGSAPHSEMVMPGLATFEQMEELRTSTDSSDAIFLKLMIAHHTGGVEMAQALLDRSTNEVVTSLAERMVRTQKSEMTYMKELLAAL